MNKSIALALKVDGLAEGQQGLLDLVDKLHFAQLDDAKLPQIVVLGDQSAGKSSVLEALTGIPFPRDAGACTRFATEIRIRRSKETSLTISIIPDKNRPHDEQIRLQQYGDTVEEKSFESMMQGAVNLIAPKNIPGRFAARDILVLEKREPDSPLLTLVDLPGLVRVSNRDQSDADIQIIEALSDRYMESPQTIILAVVGGNNDYVQAPILQKARKFDPNGTRTIGVLTKPDLTEKIGLEDKFIGLVSNKDPENFFKLGWFVLLNPGPPGPGEEWPTPEERKMREDQFFSTNKWSVLPPEMCGVGPLLRKLSIQLQRHIGRHMKSLRKQINEASLLCEKQLKELGPDRDTVGEMRIQITELFSSCNKLLAPAVDGTYKNPPGATFFPKTASREGTPATNLRARVREESERFEKRFRDSGHKISFSESTSTTPANMMGSCSKANFAKREAEPLLRQIRGSELPLDSNPRAPYILFKAYSENWSVLAQEYKDNVGVLCNEFLAEVIDYAWPSRMHDPLRMHSLEPQMCCMVEKAERELKHLIDDKELEVQPFDPEYEERLCAWRAKAAENGAAYTEEEEAVEKMLIYYELTRRIFIRNVITQVVERHLLLGMHTLFDTVDIVRMDDAAVEAVAAENKESRERRAQLKQQKKAIEEAKSLCANLAMRSEFRAHEFQDEDSLDINDEDAPKRSQSVRTRHSDQPKEPKYIPQNHIPRRPTPHNHNGSDSTKVSADEWQHNNYAPSEDAWSAMVNTLPPPPPPPRTPKGSDMETSLGQLYSPSLERPRLHYDAGREREREREKEGGLKKESMRQRLRLS